MIDTKVYVISMAGSTERRRRFSAHAADSDIDWQFFDAHTQLSTELAYSEQGAVENHGRQMSKGELGCYSSHYSVWRDFLDTESDLCLVLEDDVVVDWEGVKLLLQKDLRSYQIDYLRLYHKRPGRMQVLFSDFARRSLHIVQLYDKAYGTQGYLLTRLAAERFCAAFRDVVRPIDDQMDRYFAHGVRNLSVYPFLLIEESVRSEIGASRFKSEKTLSYALHQARSDKRSRDRAYRNYKARHLVNKVTRRLGFRK